MEPHQSEKTTGSVATKIQTQKAALWRRRSETIFLQGGHGPDGLFRWPGTRPRQGKSVPALGTAHTVASASAPACPAHCFGGMLLCPVASAVLWDVVLKSGRVGTTWGAFKTPGAWAAPQSNELGISEVGFFTSVF